MHWHGKQPIRWPSLSRGVSPARFRLLPVLVLAVYLPVLMLHTVADHRMERFTDPRVEMRAFGDPAQAIARIHEENFTTVEYLNAQAKNPALSRVDRLVYANAPLLLDQPAITSDADDTILGVYYQVSVSTVGDSSLTSIRYFVYFTDENGGTPPDERMVRFGHPFDGEMLYMVNFVGDHVLSASYQAPIHRWVPFDFEGNTHPIFAIASPNHNFRLVRREEGRLLVPLPRNDFALNPFHDPDFVALAAREAMVQHGIDISHYVYIAFQNPLAQEPVDVSVRVRGRWYHLHDTLGTGLTVQGYHQVAIPVGFTPRPEDIEELRIITPGSEPRKVEIFAVFLYPEVVFGM